MNDFPFPPIPGPSPAGIVPPLDFSAGPSNAQANSSLSTPVTIGGINTGTGTTGSMLPLIIAAAAAWFLMR